MLVVLTLYINIDLANALQKQQIFEFIVLNTAKNLLLRLMLADFPIRFLTTVSSWLSTSCYSNSAHYSNSVTAASLLAVAYFFYYYTTPLDYYDWLTLELPLAF